LAAAGKLFVSVEMWFTDFDFLVGSKVVKRNQSTAHLEENLRANGGDGTYKGEPVGRVLRNMLIGGIGVVAKPANPESVIKSIADLRSETAQDVQVYSEKVIAKNIIEDLSCKSLEDKQDREDDHMKKLFEEMAEAVKVSTEAAVKKALEEKSESTPAEKEVSPAATSTEAKASESDQNTPPADDGQIAELTATVEKLTATVKSQSEELESIRLERVTAARREELKEIGLNDEDVQRRMAKAATMTKEEFEEYKTDLLELFNNYLKGTANEENQSTEQGGETEKAESPEEKAEAKDETVEDKETEETEETQENTEASEGDEDVVIDMDKLEDAEDLGLGEVSSAKAATLDDRFYDAIANRLASRNKTWRKALSKEDDNQE
jgi:hypothetical protein